MNERLELLYAAADALRGDAALRDALCAHSGLSRAGVELALREHLEHDLAEAQRSLRSLPHTDETTVILAANVFVAAFRALVVAAISADRVYVRSSRREPVFAAALVHCARERGASWLELDPRRELTQMRGAVHVYGRDETVQAVRAAIPPGVTLYAHGPGFSAVWIAAGDPLDVAAVARDVIPFDQRGCLSPRLVCVEGLERATQFAAALHDELAEAERRVPRGRLDDAERIEWARYVATWTMAADAVHEADAHVVVLATADAPAAIAPIGRAMHVVAVPDAKVAGALLQRVAPQLVAVASAGELPVRLPHVRRAALGRLQRPPMDGPVDLRVIATA